MGKVNIKQLNVAPASGYVIGSGAGGVPIWKLEVSSVAWNQIIGNQADINLSGFTNNAGFITLGSLSAGTGISYNNLTGVITNSAPDQTVILTQGTGITITGTYPNFTITNSSPSSLITASQGLTKSTNDIQWGGTVSTSNTVTYTGTARTLYTSTRDGTSRTSSQMAFYDTNLDAASNISTGENGDLMNFNRIRLVGTGSISHAGITSSGEQRYGISVQNTALDQAVASAKSFSPNIVISGYRNFAALPAVNVLSGSGSRPEYIASSSTILGSPTSQPGSGTRWLGVGISAGRIVATDSENLADYYYGYSIGFPNNNRKGTLGNYGFISTFHISNTNAGTPNNTSPVSFLENIGDYAFYDQTGWNNYFKGSLGLGNPIPVSKLDVTGDINTTVGFKISGAATLGNYLRGDGTNFVSSALTASDLAVNSITDGLIRQSAGLSVIGRSANSTGNVADITASANDQFLVRRANALTWGGLQVADIPTGVDHGGLSGLADDDHSQYALLAGRSTGQTLIGGSASLTLVGGTSTTADLNFKTTTGVGATGADIHFLVGNNGSIEAMTILNNGNIGINKTDPSGSVEINKSDYSGRIVFSQGAITDKSVTSAFADSNGACIQQIANGYLDSGGSLNQYNSAKPSWRFQLDARSTQDNFNVARTVPAGSTTVLFRINNAGDVGIGIGTANPGSKLQVGGDIQIDLASAIYLGVPSTDGTWRIIRSGNDLLSQRRESGSYVTKQTITP